MRMRVDNREVGGAEPKGSSYDGFIVSAVLGLLALLLGFSFSLAVQRFEERRQLVVEEANAIGTAYLRVQLLDQPHRARLSSLLVQHVDNEIDVASEGFPSSGPVRERSDRVLTDIWAATLAALDSPKTSPFAYALASAMNAVIDLDASRMAARAARVPQRVFVILLIYLLSAATLLGYESEKGRATMIAVSVLVSMTLSLLLVMDIDRPATGGIRETQEPMERLQATLAHQPPAVFDRWRGSAAGP
ncbi:MAG TPA: hypothetical protein VMU08_18560 [Rhizomicrobium sp.]|nr:hypothetical protein [Rhizomicrobium sp.]